MDQSLPTSFDNTSAVANLMPMYFASQVGQQNQIAQDNNAALQRAFVNEQAQKEKERPLTLQDMMAKNNFLAAQTRHQDALTRGSNLTSDQTQALMPSAIMSGIGKNVASTTQSQSETGYNQADIEGQAAAALRTMPDGPAGVAAKVKYIKDTFHLPNTPEVDQQLASNMDNMSGMLQAHSDQVYRNHPSVQAAQSKSGAEYERALLASGTQQAVAKTGADSREQVAATAATAKYETAIAKNLTDAKNRAASLRQIASDPKRSIAERQAAAQEAEFQERLVANNLAIANQAKNETGIATSELFNQKPDGVPLNVTPPKNPQPTFQTPGLPAPVAPPQAAPAAPGVSAAKIAVPQGRVLVRNVRTGTMGHIPQEQLDQAMKDGYEMVR